MKRKRKEKKMRPKKRLGCFRSMMKDQYAEVSTVPSEKAPARPEEVMYQKPTDACDVVPVGAEAVAVTPVLVETAFVGAVPPAKSAPATEVGKEAVAPPVALSAYFVANTERRLPSPALVADAFAAPERSKNFGTDIEARMPMIAMTITSSISVKP